jgi:hypothetical protein
VGKWAIWVQWSRHMLLFKLSLRIKIPSFRFGLQDTFIVKEYLYWT